MLSCAMGGYVYFHWTAAYHDLVLMASPAHYASCDFSGATTLVPVADGSDGSDAADQMSYYLPCGTAGQDLYLSCSAGSHCTGGQKLHVQVSTTARVYSATDPTLLLLHSDSLRRVMALLGHRVDSSTGFAYLDLGYQTEASANVSLDMVWCLEVAPRSFEASCFTRPLSTLDLNEIASPPAKTRLHRHPNAT